MAVLASNWLKRWTTASKKLPKTGPYPKRLGLQHDRSAATRGRMDGGRTMRRDRPPLPNRTENGSAGTLCSVAPRR